MIGLIIALTIISQSGILIESYRQEIFEEVVYRSQEDSYYFYGDVDIEMWISDISGSNKYTNYEYLNTLINESIIQGNYSDYVVNNYWYNRLQSYVWLNTTEYDHSDKGMNTDRIEIFASSAIEFYTELEKIFNSTGIGRLPENSSEIILLHSKREYDYSIEEDRKRFENVTLGAKVNITLCRNCEETTPNKTVKIIGVIDFVLRESRYSDNSTKLLQKYFRFYRSGYYLLTHPLFMEQTIKELSDPSLDGNVDGGRIYGKIILDKSHFDAYNVKIEEIKLLSFTRALRGKFKPIFRDSAIHPRILDNLRMYETTVFVLLTIMLLFSFPVLCIALYLVVYSFSLIRRQKQIQIGIIKTRGGSWFQILVILFGEMLISTVFAVLVGFLLSTLLATVVMCSTNYLEFLGAPVPVHFSIDIFQILIFLGLILAILLNFRNIIRMSRQEIVMTLEPTETQEPVWKRYYLDILFFVIGTTTWVILMTLLRAINEGVSMEDPSFFFILNIINLLGIPAPLFIFLGTIMVIARIFPLLTKKLSDLLWKFEGGINAFSISNIIRHKRAANRAVLLITFALSFSILSSSLIFSIDETERLKCYYEVGADLSISTGSSLDNSVLKVLEQNVSHLTSISGVYEIDYYPLDDNYHRRYHLFFVDASTYAKTAFVDPCFKLSSSLSSLMDEIKDNETIILYEGNLKAHISKPKIGDHFSFAFENDTMTEYISFRIGGTFKYWPRMYPYEGYNLADNFWGIGSLGMFNRLNQSNYIGTSHAAYQAKIDSLSNIDETIECINNVTGILPKSPALAYKEYTGEFRRFFTLSVLNSDLIVCIVVTVIGVIMFSFFTYVERGKEIGVERALGMTKFQTAQSFLIEAATILTFGSIIGYLTGVYFVAMFLQITQFGVTIPPQIVIHPTMLLIQILLGIFIMGGIGTIIPAYLATRKDISSILKVE